MYNKSTNVNDYYIWARGKTTNIALQKLLESTTNTHFDRMQIHNQLFMLNMWAHCLPVLVTCICVISRRNVIKRKRRTRWCTQIWIFLVKLSRNWSRKMVFQFYYYYHVHIMCISVHIPCFVQDVFRFLWILDRCFFYLDLDCIVMIQHRRWCELCYWGNHKKRWATEAPPTELD